MSIRLRRLAAEHDQVAEDFAGHRFIRLIDTRGNPPEKYTFEFYVRGLVPEGEEDFVEGNAHRAEVVLPRDFPRRPPFCRMITPVFHPNIDPRRICIGDHWSAGQTVSLLVVRIAQMICFQSYNVKSPLNSIAAAWTEQNMEYLPLTREDLGAG